jgi:hypothetical protein
MSVRAQNSHMIVVTLNMYYTHDHYSRNLRCAHHQLLDIGDGLGFAPLRADKRQTKAASSQTSWRPLLAEKKSHLIFYIDTRMNLGALQMTCNGGNGELRKPSARGQSHGSLRGCKARSFELRGITTSGFLSMACGSLHTLRVNEKAISPAENRLRSCVGYDLHE